MTDPDHHRADASREELTARLEQFFQRALSFVHAQGLDRLVDLDLSMSQARVLFTVAHAGEPLPIGAIAEQVGTTLATAGRAVESLVRSGALERRESAEDRRVKLVGLTERGLEIVDAQHAQKRAALHTLVERLDPTDAEDLDRVLATILAGDALRPTDREEGRP